jgi:hypothetical protein
MHAARRMVLFAFIIILCAGCSRSSHVYVQTDIPYQAGINMVINSFNLLVYDLYLGKDGSPRMAMDHHFGNRIEFY